MDQRNRFTPQIYYDEFYTDMRTQKTEKDILGPYDISHYVGEDNEVSVSFSALNAEYLQNNDPDATEEREYQIVPQAVTGFLTSNGKYFSTEWEANLYEKSLELNHRVTSAVVQLKKDYDVVNLQYDHDRKDETGINRFFQTLVPKVIEFIDINEDLILAYINARQTVIPDPDHHQSGEITLRDNELGGQTEATDQDDDTRVRSDADTPVASTPDAEDHTTRTGRKPKK